MAISWISTTPATGELADTRRAFFSGVRRMKAPVAFCWATVPRTQASSTLTVVCAHRLVADRASTAAARVVVNRLRWVMKISW